MQRKYFWRPRNSNNLAALLNNFGHRISSAEKKLARDPTAFFEYVLAIHTTTRDSFMTR